MKEVKEWKGLFYNKIDYSDRYEISYMGEIRNKKTKQIRKQTISRNYQKIVILSHGKPVTIKIHRAVAENFLLNEDLSLQVNHIDGNKLNNYYKNLEWCTIKRNVQHAWETGLTSFEINKSKPRAILQEQDIVFILNNYIPYHKEFGGRPLGQKFNISKGRIIQIVNNNAYKWIDRNNIINPFIKK